MDFFCSQCKKQYSSYKSLWNHNKKFHVTNINTYNQCINANINNCQQSSNKLLITSNKSYNCRQCNKQFRFLQARHRHEKTCKTKENKEIENEKEFYLEEKRLELEIKKQENENLRLQLKLKELENTNNNEISI